MESHVTDVRLVDTGEIIGVDDLLTFGLEAAGVIGPWHVQAEYMTSEIRRGAGDDPRFDGWYVETGYLLTGESRPYDASLGKFERIKPMHTAGAWQIAARYSTLDLVDAGIEGGTQDNITVGLNWYPNYNFRLTANYIKVIHHERQGVSDEPSVFQIRAQVAF